MRQPPAAMFQHRTNEEGVLSVSKNKDPRLALPGFGRPLDFAPREQNIYGVESRSLFPSALDDRDIAYGYTESVFLDIIQPLLTLFSLPALTLREMEMVKTMEDITDIPQWWKKVRGGSFHPPLHDHEAKTSRSTSLELQRSGKKWP